jgi:hypothetical protein
MNAYMDFCMHQDCNLLNIERFFSRIPEQGSFIASGRHSVTAVVVSDTTKETFCIYCGDERIE